MFARVVRINKNTRGWPLSTTLALQSLSAFAPLLLLRIRYLLLRSHGCQIAKFDPFLSLDCARVEGVGAQSKEGKG